MLRILTFNTWKCEGDYFARLALMRQQLARLDVDVLCLQESFVAPTGQVADHQRGESLAVDTGKALAQALGMQLHHAPARHKSRAFQGAMVPSTSGLAVLTRSHADAMEVFQLPQDARDGERIAQALLVRVEDAPPIRIINLHLTHLRDRDDLRVAQLEAVLARWGGDETPVLLAGDFNATFEGPSFSPLRARSDLDVGPVPPDEWSGTLLTATPSRAIDHVLLLRGEHSPAPTILSRRRVLDLADAAGLLPSDHAGVLVELGF